MNIIFDFDGTIADTLEVMMEIYKDLQSDAPEPTPAEVLRLRGMSLLHVMRELKVRPWKVPFLVAHGRKRLRKRMPQVEVFAGIPEATHDLVAAGHRLFIMSSNSVQNIRYLLHKYDMNTEFIKIYGGVGVFGKARVLRRVLRQNRLEAHDTWYVGDEVRDIEAAQAVGVRVAAVAWGYNTPEVLRSHAPDCLLASPKELMKTLTAK